jgi:hypothetical protein
MRKLTLFVTVLAVLALAYSTWANHHSSRPIIMEDEVINTLLSAPASKRGIKNKKPAIDYIVETWDPLKKSGGKKIEAWDTNIPGYEKDKLWLVYIKSDTEEQILLSLHKNVLPLAMCPKPTEQERKQD